MFKVGDKVKVREDLKERLHYGGHFFAKEMCDYRGNTYEISSVCGLSPRIYTLKSCCDKSGYKWEFTEEMLEPVEKVGISENATTTSTIDYQQKYESADKVYQDLLKSFKEQEERIKELNEYIQRLEDVISKTTNDNCRLTRQVKTAKAILKILWEDAEVAENG